MTTRRTFLRRSFAGSVGLLAASAFSRVYASAAAADAIQPFKGTDTFDRILAKAVAGHWDKLPIGQTMGKIAMELKGTPYVGFTLELSKDREVCAVNLDGLDCVTFFEDTLDFARMLKKGGRTPEALLAEVTYTRYRGGHLTDYTSRLHYTTDWFYDNQQKGVVHILTPDLPGAEPFTQKVGIMSAKPKYYRQLVAHPEMVPVIHKIETEINARNARMMKYIPMDKLPEAESLLQTGDIIAVCGHERGIDIPHTGLIYKDDAGVPHFMDASSIKTSMKVTLEPGPVSKALNWSHSLTGAMFARPLEPRAS